MTWMQQLFKSKAGKAFSHESMIHLSDIALLSPLGL